MTRRICRLLVLAVVLFPATSEADYLEVRRAATLKAEAESDGPVVGRPAVGTRLVLLSSNQTNGYYSAQIPGGASGFIYRTLVRRRPGEIPGPVGGGASSVVDSDHCLMSCPGGAPAANDVITREIYTLSNNGTTKFADWVAYRTTTDTIGPTKPRNWRADPLLPADRTLEPEDYTGANAALGTDRGHQGPLASFTSTEHWRDTNILSNITPQQAALNQGPWERLESAERELAKQEGVQAVFSVTGPLYERMMQALPKADEPHRLPSGYWKIVAVEREEGIDVAAFIMDQSTPRNDDFCEHRVTVDEVEKRSSLNFFSALEDSLEVQIEGSPGALLGRLGCGQ